MSNPYSFVGFWKVLDCVSISLPTELSGIEGTVFQLSKTGNVTWEVSNHAVPSPLFKCDTYEIVSNCNTNFVLRFGMYKGYTIDCLVKLSEIDIELILISDKLCLLLCQKFEHINQKDLYELPFSLFPALQNGYFSDLIIKASSNKEFHVHTCILKLSAPEINWLSHPPPLSSLSEEVITAILHFLYAQCLPKALEENIVKDVISVTSEIPGLENLVTVCHQYINNINVKKQIYTLMSDIQQCGSHMVENFTSKHSSLNNQPDDFSSDPAKLCFAVKNSIQEAAVAGTKLLVLCDLYKKQRDQFSREEDHEIILYAKSRIPILVKQLDCFLQALKMTINNSLTSKSRELASYLVPKVETMFNTILSLLIKIKAILKVLLSKMGLEKANSESMVENLEQYLDKLLLDNEMSKLGAAIDLITNVFGYLHRKKEYFKVMTSERKIQSVAGSLEQTVLELECFMLKTKGFSLLLESLFHQNDSLFWFHVSTSIVSEVLKTLRVNKESLKDFLIQLCELVERDSFSQSLEELGLLDSFPNAGGNPRKPEGSAEETIGNQTSCNAGDFICMSPPARCSNLSRAARDLFKSGKETDMVFEVITSVDSDEIGDHGENISAEPETETNSQREVFEVAAHRVIVAARCDWFRKALLSGMQEDINRKIQVHNTRPRLFLLFLEYLYSGQVDCSTLNADLMSEMLFLSDRYEFDSLKQICESELKSHLNTKSVLHLFILADRFNAAILKANCKQFIAHHPEVVDGDLYEELPDDLQTEVYDAVICGKPQTVAYFLERNSPTPSDSDSDIEYMMNSFRIDECRRNE